MRPSSAANTTSNIRLIRLGQGRSKPVRWGMKRRFQRIDDSLSVSIASVSERNRMPRALKSSSSAIRWGRLRPGLSSFRTVNVSPGSRAFRQRASAGLFRAPPDTLDPRTPSNTRPCVVPWSGGSTFDRLYWCGHSRISCRALRNNKVGPRKGRFTGAAVSPETYPF